MKSRLYKTLTIAALLGLTVGAAQAASSVVTQTHIQHKPYGGMDVVDYRVFDTNADGYLTRLEVGERLFYVFDRDGNQLIDNIEFDHPMVMTFAPMEKATFQYVDFNGDGVADQTSVTRESFLKETGLSRFADNTGGLAAADFIEQPMKRVDRDLSGQIDIKEWKEAYNALMKPLPQNDTFRYNE